MKLQRHNSGTMTDQHGNGSSARSSESMVCPRCRSRLSLSHNGETAILKVDIDSGLLPAACTIFIDPHAHRISRTTDDYEAMVRAGVVAVVEPTFWLGQAPREADALGRSPGVGPRPPVPFLQCTRSTAPHGYHLELIL